MVQAILPLKLLIGENQRLRSRQKQTKNAISTIWTVCIPVAARFDRDQLTIRESDAISATEIRDCVRNSMER